MAQSRGIWLIRHGETTWSLSGAHTSRTDLDLTPEGRRRAEALRGVLQVHSFGVVLTSPLQRAMETCRLAGLGDAAQIEPKLVEWDYGDYEGRTTADIRKERPDWNLWRDGAPSGEMPADVYARAAAVISRIEKVDGDVAVFSHGHFLRVLTSCWLGLRPEDGRLFVLGTGTISILGYERETRAMLRWNQPVS